MENEKWKRLGIVIVGVVAVAWILWACFGKKIKVLYTSLNSFKDENLAYTFQHTPEIQPTKRICKGENTLSMRTLMGTPAMKVIAKYGMREEPCTYRRYLSINTEILGQVITNATGYSLAEYMEIKLWKKLDVAHDAYWTLSNGTELAMGGLSVSLRDYARFARLYLNGGSYNGEQIIAQDWVCDSMDISAEYSKPGANQDAYNAIGYGYQWWIPEGNQGEFMAIGVYGQWIYVNPSNHVIIVKTSADPDFMEKGYELKHVEFFRAIASGIA